MGESTGEPVVRLDGDRVVLRLDAEPGAEVVLLPLAGEEPTVAVSPARALELLDGLQDLRSELRDAVAEQGLRAAEQRALATAIGVLINEPLLAGWHSLEPHGYDADSGGRAIQVTYFDDRSPDALRQYAAKVGLPASEVEDWLVVESGEGEGRIRLRAYRRQEKPAVPRDVGDPYAIPANRIGES